MWISKNILKPKEFIFEQAKYITSGRTICFGTYRVYKKITQFENRLEI